MIARTWHGITPVAKADEYFEYLNRTGVAEYQEVPGNLGVYVLRRIEQDKAHFLLLTLWESVTAIQQFAGEDIDQAKYYPEDAQYLLAFEPTVTHYEVLVP